ncbi:MAG: hypothetical protein JW795_12455 [Chitinivibrionales bacterium]|nr:hypothetical protein [Chitinivibrionales bacterium]
MQTETIQSLLIEIKGIYVVMGQQTEIMPDDASTEYITKLITLRSNCLSQIKSMRNRLDSSFPRWQDECSHNQEISRLHEEVTTLITLEISRTATLEHLITDRLSELRKQLGVLSSHSRAARSYSHHT